MFIHEKILAGEICNECHHKTSKHQQVCIENIYNGVNWVYCNCNFDFNNLRLAFTILETFSGNSNSGHGGFFIEDQIRRCGFCSCDIQTHRFVDEFWQAGKCDNPYCYINCEKWIPSEVFI